LDEQGWGELNDLLAKVLAQSADIASKSAKRLTKSDDEGMTTLFVMMHFETPKS